VELSEHGVDVGLGDECEEVFEHGVDVGLVDE